ncbi:MAG: ABC-type transport auxiliary lipoprotein family protein [Methylococcales bacterium]
MSGLLRVSALVCCCLVWFTISACQSGPKPRQSYYQLAPEIRQQSPDPKACGTILVSRVESRGFAGGRAIVFRESADSLEVQRYHYHFWSQSPDSMIQEGITLSLRATGLFRYVITPAERAQADWIVSGTLLRLEHFPNAAPANIVLEVELGVVAAKTHETIFLKRYLENGSATNNSVNDAVLALNHALERMLANIQYDMTKKSTDQRTSCERSE